MICYDVEFPEMIRHLALSGADLVLVPTALPASEHAAFIARSIIPVRAFENQVFVAYANHAGRDDAFAYAGLSGIAAPDGSDELRSATRGWSATGAGRIHAWARRVLCVPCTRRTRRRGVK